VELASCVRQPGANIIKLLFSLSPTLEKLARVFILGKLSQTSLMIGNEGVYCGGKPVASLTSIRLALKMPGRNPLAYFAATSVTKKTSLMALAPGVRDHLDRSVLREASLQRTTTRRRFKRGMDFFRKSQHRILLLAGRNIITLFLGRQCWGRISRSVCLWQGFSG